MCYLAQTANLVSIEVTQGPRKDAHVTFLTSIPSLFVTISVFPSLSLSRPPSASTKLSPVTAY